MNAHRVNEMLKARMRSRPSEDGSSRPRDAEGSDRRRRRQNPAEVSAEARRRLLRSNSEHRPNSGQVRRELVARIRDEIASGEYDLDARMGPAVDRLIFDLSPESAPA